jgi:hypothetical protein
MDPGPAPEKMRAEFSSGGNTAKFSVPTTLVTFVGRPHLAGVPHRTFPWRSLTLDERAEKSLFGHH